MRTRFFPRPLFICLLVGAMALAAGCAGSDSSSSGGGSTDDSTTNVITSGTISGLAFTVVDGTVTQDTADGPITAGATEAAIVFDSDLATLATSTLVLFQVQSTISDGGSVAAMGFGSGGDSFAAALMGGIRRIGSTFEYGLFWGLEDTPPRGGAFSNAVDAPDGNIPLIVGMDNSYTPAVIGIWDPDTPDTAPFESCNNPPTNYGVEIEDNAGIAGGGVVDKGNGLGAGISFQNATVSGVDISDSVTLACW